jgi:hypothetical protein
MIAARLMDTSPPVYFSGVAVTVPIRIIGATPNEKGDLLTRLARDLFFTLGYDDCYFDVHKTGREIDVIASHRFEPRRLVAECKNQAAPVGGAATNKFFGVLDGERRRITDRSVHGYFISLSGFTGSAVEQEAEFGNSRFVMLTGGQVADELVKGNIVVGPDRAVRAAEQMMNGVEGDYSWDHNIQLLGDKLGWLWQVCLISSTTGHAVCLIHADGTPLSVQRTNELVATARAARDPLASIMIVNTKMQRGPELTTIKSRYLSYLTRDFGVITLEGLPADQDVGSKQFKLENLYVPLRLSDISADAFVEEGARVYSFGSDVRDADGDTEPTKTSLLGKTLEQHSHLAILGLPGSGKTTMLKRLAVAYANPGRLRDSNDALPEREWFPILLRCRSLGEHTKQPILSVLSAQVERAEMPEDRADFTRLVQEELRDGKVLLLVDGLDEIASTSDRTAFVSQLRTFIGTYPTCRIVITSREAGFRAVAGAVRSVCHATRVENLDNDAIRTLTRYWHREVVGTAKAVERDAASLGEAIIRTDRVRRLATNPLLLTTLLLVKRWVGQLPRKRSVLYDKAIEVLLMTWNAEGHEPLDPEEAMPQLAFAAYAMMTGGQSSITLDELAAHLTDARHNLPEVLSYARMSVHEFLNRVEERSSLMTLNGHRLVDGVLKPTYEFKHLTFQEYLAALAIVNGWLPEEFQDSSPTAILGDRINTTAWQEVVSLTAVLSGKRASDIVRALLAYQPQESAENQAAPVDVFQRPPIYANILNCLIDEVAITPELAAEAIEFCIRHTVQYDTPMSPVHALHGGRYDSLVREISFKYMQLDDPQFDDFAAAIAAIGSLDCSTRRGDKDEREEWIYSRLQSGDREQMLLAGSALMEIAYRKATTRIQNPDTVDPEILNLAKPTHFVINYLLNTEEESDVSFIFIWALAWSLRTEKKLDPSIINRIQIRLVTAWRSLGFCRYSRFAAWALYECPLVGEWKVSEEDKTRLLEFAQAALEFNGTARFEASFSQAAALATFYYLTESSERPALLPVAVETLLKKNQIHEFARTLLPALGPDGAAALEKAKTESNRAYEAANDSE